MQRKMVTYWAQIGYLNFSLGAQDIKANLFISDLKKGNERIKKGKILYSKENYTTYSQFNQRSYLKVSTVILRGVHSSSTIPGIFLVLKT